MAIYNSEAEKLALLIDEVEAELVGLQSKLFRVRRALQKAAGKPVGFQYDSQTCRDDADAQRAVSPAASEAK